MTTWSLIEDRFVPSLASTHESLFTIGNGYLSTRGSFEESLTGEMRASFIQGLFVNPPAELPLLGTVPDWTGLTISIDGAPFNLDRRPAGYKRSLDFRSGVLDREVLWRGPETGVMKLRFRRLVSMAEPHLAALEVTITALTSHASIRIETGIDAGIPSPITPAWNPTAWHRPNPNRIKLLSESIDGAQTLEVEAVLYGAPIDYFRVRVLRAKTGFSTTPTARLTLGSMKLYNLDHVGIAVNDLDAAIAGYLDRYGVEPIHRQVVADQGVEEAMIPIGGSFVQLLGALSPHTPVGRFLGRKGEGLHHIAYAVLDIDEALAHLAARGARLIDEFPRVGGSGARIAFVHPSDLAGTLIELVEHPDG